MRNFTVGLFCLTLSLSAFSQEARSPQELAVQIQKLIEANDTNSIAKLVHSSAEPGSVERLKSMLATYVGATNLKVYAVPKDDKEAVREFLAQSSVPGALKPLEERIKKYADNGAFFELVPLGDLVISGKRTNVPSSGSSTSVVYGMLDGKYLVIFAKRK
jgi:hypothetical protein